jgi:hypothetical protein
VTPLAGAAVWAVVPFAPEAPFRLYAGPGAEPRVVPDVAPLIRAARRGGDPQLTYLVAGKIRPVLAELHERVVRFYRLDVRRLVEHRLRELAAAQRRRAR